MTTTLWHDDNGRVLCADHLGHYGQASIAAKPQAKQHRTPLGTIRRYTNDEAADFLTFLAHDLRMVDPTGCETCDYRS